MVTPGRAIGVLALFVVAARAEPDPWPAAADLCARGRFDEAAALAGNRPGLAAFVAAHRQLAAGEAGAALKALAPLPVNAHVAEAGVRAAIAADDPDALVRYLEIGRDPDLAVALAGRRALDRVDIPEPLRLDEAQARRDVAAAESRLAAAVAGGEKKAIASARAALNSAQAELAGVVKRIERAARSAADLVRPVPAAVAAVRAVLGPGEAFVWYGPGAAFVVTRSDARAVPLESEEVLRSALAAFRPHRRGTPDGKVLRALLAAPLNLKAHRRVVVSPTEDLRDVPFCLLFPQQDVAYAHSATALVMLRGQATLPSAGVLAVGGIDPGPSFPPLPETEREARAVGDTLLLGAAATREGLLETLEAGPAFAEASAGASALRASKRWRALHLATYGFHDEARPSLSYLQLADGRLSVFHVFRMRVRADLVVLSASRTARAFPRAFLLAGAPRVLASLWKIDDAATRALMERFHKEWPDHRAPTALRKAQDSVRLHAKWRDPYYWAAWQLWGRGD